MTQMSDANPVGRFLKDDAPIILDGGLATELEQRGFQLTDSLWSARVLIENPAAIEQLHYDYLAAGADCIITSSYQATFAGMAGRGIDHDRAVEIFRKSVELARCARDRFWTEHRGMENRQYPLVAASIGPYGAALADGSEFRGDYGVGRESLATFHRERLELLASLGADLLACESIPRLLEAEAIVDVLQDLPATKAWFTFTCRDEKRTSHGELIRDCAAFLSEVPQVIAIGVNCTAPIYVESLIEEVRAASPKPIVVYPNSGEVWDAATRGWTGAGDVDQFTSLAGRWRDAGARLIGGCCRTGPQHIRSLKDAFRG